MTRAFTELLSAFNRKLGEISGDCVCIHLVSGSSYIAVVTDRMLTSFIAGPHSAFRL